MCHFFQSRSWARPRYHEFPAGHECTEYTERVIMHVSKMEPGGEQRHENGHLICWDLEIWFAVLGSC
jgi:hypothetical protein